MIQQSKENLRQLKITHVTPSRIFGLEDLSYAKGEPALSLSFLTLSFFELPFGLVDRDTEKFLGVEYGKTLEESRFTDELLLS